MKNDDYLWDRSGEPDPEVARLEELLSPLAYRPQSAVRRYRRWPLLASIAAGVALVVCGTVWYAVRQHGPAWNVISSADSKVRRQMSRGSTVETDSASRLRLELSTFGHVDVEPNTRLKLLVTKADEQRMDLVRGKIHALIWAPPHRFYVNTPSATTVDLGCSYTLEVNAAGESVAHVDIGWVAFEERGVESFIPAQAVCITRRGRGPGSPYYDDASTALREGLRRFDASGDISAIPGVLTAARDRDAMSIWHLLRRAPREERGVIFDRLARLVKMPDGVTREQAIDGNEQALDRIWDSLGLGNIDWWRRWKR